MGVRFPFLAVFALSLLFIAPVCPAEDSLAQELEQAARKKLASKLTRLGQTLEMREGSSPEGGSRGADLDANSGNPSRANTAMHSYAKPYCLKWRNFYQCEQWLDPDVSNHGFQGDRSPGEGVVASNWQRFGQQEEIGKAYSIWEFEKNDGLSVIDADGKFTNVGIQNMWLKDTVRDEVERVGEDSARRQISLVNDETATRGSKGKVLPNMESLRYMASRWTKVMRNRLVSSLFERRAAKSGIEFILGEDIPNCEAYVARMQVDQEETKTQERLKFQARLTPATLAMTLQERRQLCEQMMASSIDAVNPQVRDNQVTEGEAAQEAVDEKLMRANIAAIDFAGVDPSQYAEGLREDQISAPRYEWDEGARTNRLVVERNSKTIQDYNNQLELSAAAWKSAAARSQNIEDVSSEIRDKKITKGGMSLVDLNNLTPEMKDHLKETGFQAATTEVRAPAQQMGKTLERTASQLTVNRR